MHIGVGTIGYKTVKSQKLHKNMAAGNLLVS